MLQKTLFLFVLLLAAPFSQAQYGAVSDLGSGNAGIRVAAFDGSASVAANGSSKGRVGDGKVGDLIRVQAGSTQFSGAGSSFSANLSSGKTYLVAYVSGRPVGVFELSGGKPSRSASTVILLNTSGGGKSFSANGNALGSVSNGRSKTVEIAPARTTFSAGTLSSKAVSLRRGKVGVAIVTASGLFFAS